MAFSLKFNSLSHYPLTINFRGHSSLLLTFLNAELPPFSHVCVQTCIKHRHFALFAFLTADAIEIDTTYKNIFGFLISDNPMSISTVYRLRLFCCSSALSAT